MHNYNTITLITLIIVVTFSSVAVATLQNGLIVYYPFDEAAGKTASDESKNNNDGELMGSAAWAQNEGKIEGAARFDGGDGSVVDENGADYINGLEAFSASIWVKSDSAPHDSGIFIAKDPAGGDDSFTLRYDSAGWKVPAATTLIKAGFTTTGGGIQYESADNTQTTEWQHLVVTWSSGNKLALYIDGKLDEPQYNNDIREGSISTATKLIIGKGGKDNAGTSWTGLIDEVRIYDRVLNMAEIEELSTGVLPVEARDKLATTWALQKKIRF